jgi:hypothetical protein
MIDYQIAVDWFKTPLCCSALEEEPRPRTEREKEEPMLKSTFWTQRRFTGITLIVGCLLFLGALGLMPRDTMGNFMVNLPLREQLLVIAAQTSLFQWSFSLIISGLIVTLLGLAMLTMLFRDAFDRTFSSLALLVSLFGDVLMVIYIAFPLGIAPMAAQETARTGVVPGYYVQLTLWTQPLFVIYTILAFSALAAYGGAILSTRVLPHWVGWLALVYALAGLVLAGVTAGNVPPFLHHLVPMVMGVLLLLRWSQASPEKDERQRHASP